MARIVYLPREINRALDKIAESGRKAEGILFCEDLNCGSQNACIEAFWVNLPYDADIQSRQNREIADEFFRKNPSYWPIKFFTYPEKFERVGWICIRSREFNEIEKEVKNNNSVAMAITPTMKWLIGRDNPRLMIIESPVGYKEKNRIIMRGLQQIAENRGLGMGINIQL